MTEAKYSGANNSSQVYFSAMAFISATYQHACPMIQVRIHLHRFKTAHPGSLFDSDTGACRGYLKVLPPSNVMKCQNSRAVWIEQASTIFD